MSSCWRILRRGRGSVELQEEMHSDGGSSSDGSFDSVISAAAAGINVGYPAVVTADLSFELNDSKVTVPGTAVDPSMTMLDYLRDHGHTGTKRSCAEGGCGACTILLDGESVNACLLPLCAASGRKITTIEGKKGSKVASKLAEHNGSQCGFCSPGMVMSMESLLEECGSNKPTPEMVEKCIDGNICRCTGYRGILDAFQTFASSDIEDISTNPCCAKLTADSTINPENKASGKCSVRSAGSCGPETTVLGSDMMAKPQWQSPKSLKALLHLLSSQDSAALISGGTSKGVTKYYDGTLVGSPPTAPKILVSTFNDKALRIGAAETITSAMNAIKAHIKLSPTTFNQVLDHWEYVANHNVRRLGTIGGNLGIAIQHTGFASDIAIVLLGIGALVEIADVQSRATSTVPLSTLFISLNAAAPKPQSYVITSILFPLGKDNAVLQSYKVRLRRQNAHAIVNGAIMVSFNQSGSTVVKDIKAYFGGLSDKGPFQSKKLELVLMNKDITIQTTFQMALSALKKDLAVMDCSEYKIRLPQAFLYKSFLSMQPNLPDDLVSASVSFRKRPISKGKVSYDHVSKKSEYPVSKPSTKRAAILQTEGSATYAADEPFDTNGLHLAFVLSTVAKAAAFTLDTRAAEMNGAIVIDYKMLSKKGISNELSQDEELLTSGGINFAGQRLAIVASSSHANALAAAQAVKVSYMGVSDDAVLTIEDAVKAKAFFDQKPQTFTKGQAQTALDNAPVVVNGVAECGHQYHFYMETQTSVVFPSSEGLNVITSTQDVSSVQTQIGKIVGLPSSKINVQVRRCGGGYGGKITKNTPVASAAAAAAIILGKPVKLEMELLQNMAMLGSRKPHQFRYKVGANMDGTVTAVTGQIYNLQGWQSDLGGGTSGLNSLEASIDNAYNIANWDLQGWACKTNTPANTACRAPTFLPGTFLIEQIMDHVAVACGLDPIDVRRKNAYHVDDETIGGQKLHYCKVDETLDEITKISNLSKRKEEVSAFNKANRLVKRGLAVMPQKYYLPAGLGYPSIVTVNADGSVQVCQGGIELGQGLHTKIAQVAAYELKCDESAVTVLPTSSGSIGSSFSCTGGSIGSEGASASTILACQQVYASVPGAKSFGDIVKAASGSGGVQGRGCWNGSNAQAGGGVPAPSPYGGSQYVSYGAAATEVEIDLLTGESTVVRTDLVHDSGVSLNPEIDCGQAQGAFIMGLGYMLTEEFQFDNDAPNLGRNTTLGTWEYKPPSSQDIPEVFNVKLLPNAPNPLGVLRSKAVGEPPLLLSISIILAVRNALTAYEQRTPGFARGETDKFIQITAPATVERVQMAANVDITSQSIN